MKLYGVVVRQAYYDKSNHNFNGTMEFRKIPASNPTEALNYVKALMSLVGIKVVRDADYDSVWVEKPEYWKNECR